MTEMRSQKQLKKQRKFEHKMASPEKLQKCRYNFLAFTGRFELIWRSMFSTNKYQICCQTTKINQDWYHFMIVDGVSGVAENTPC